MDRRLNQARITRVPLVAPLPAQPLGFSEWTASVKAEKKLEERFLTYKVSNGICRIEYKTMNKLK